MNKEEKQAYLEKLKQNLDVIFKDMVISLIIFLVLSGISRSGAPLE